MKSEQEASSCSKNRLLWNKKEKNDLPVALTFLDESFAWRPRQHTDVSPIVITQRGGILSSEKRNDEVDI